MTFNFLRAVKLPYYNDKVVWTICPYSGSLLRGSNEKITHERIPIKVVKALEYCNNPYKCQNGIPRSKSRADNNLIEVVCKMHNRILFIGNSRFYMSRIYASIKKLIFKNSIEAISYINSLPPQLERKHELCLQRALLTAKTSKSFVEDGVLFIGAFLPTGDMHAWIIENGIQPDLDDRGWINYRPLLAFYH